MTQWRSRIVESGFENPSQLLANPFNWRIHSRHQQEATVSVLSSIGWVQRVMVNITTGHVVDGHMRILLAMRHGEDEVPVDYVELTPAEEMIVLATLDPIGAMAATDKDLLDETLRGAQTTDADVQKLLADIAKSKGLYNEDTRKAGADAEETVKKLAASEEPGSDKRSKFQQGYGVLVTVEDETQQEELFNRLQAEGWTCRAVTT